VSTPPPPPPPPGYGQPAYGQPAYGQPGYGYQPPRDHPRATTSLVLGILGLVLCQLLGPVALVMGRKAVKEIDASGGALGGRGSATAGWVCGLVATILLVVSAVAVAVAVAFAVATSSTS
jgi:Domain of unknown function (DUF4190)